MATYDNLPVYKTTYDLLILVFIVVKEFTKEYKYTLGDKIKETIITLMENVYRANGNFENRKANIRAARENIEVIRLYMRLAKDLKIVSLSRFVDLASKIESISKQLFAWETATNR